MSIKATDNPEVLYAGEGVVTVDADTISALKEGALHTERRRIRLCTHPGVDDRLHEMLIIHERGTYVRPHKHLGKSESFHVIEGHADVVVFGEDGRVAQVIPVGEYGSGRMFYYRMAEPLFHTLLIHSDVLVFHETTNGPFRREDTVFAPWAPEERDTAGVASFLAEVEKAVRRS